MPFLEIVIRPFYRNNRVFLEIIDMFSRSKSLFLENIKNTPRNRRFDMFSDGACNNSTLLNSFIFPPAKCLHYKALRSTLLGSRKFIEQ